MTTTTTTTTMTTTMTTTTMTTAPQQRRPRLHVMIGEGGVGKTTLAAALALALAEKREEGKKECGGNRVALLSIDPARRLQGALGLRLDEQEVIVPTARGKLHAALLVPDVTLRRWATGGLSDDDGMRTRLTENRLFRMLADRLATTTDVIAAVRIAEWMENDPSLTDFVIDTAPGRNGIELVRRPRALHNFLDGKLLHWLRRPRSLGIRMLRSLAPVGGIELLADLVQLVGAVEQPFQQILHRLEQAQAWLHEPSTSLLIVTTIREDAIRAATVLRDALAEASLTPSAILVNRTFPPEIGAELQRLERLQRLRATTTGADPESATLLHYAQAYLDMQSRVLAQAAAAAPSVIALPSVSGLDDDGAGRLERLTELGRALVNRV